MDLRLALRSTPPQLRQHTARFSLRPTLAKTAHLQQLRQADRAQDDQGQERQPSSQQRTSTWACAAHGLTTASPLAAPALPPSGIAGGARHCTSKMSGETVRARRGRRPRWRPQLGVGAAPPKRLGLATWSTKRRVQPCQTDVESLIGSTPDGVRWAEATVILARGLAEQSGALRVSDAGWGMPRGGAG